MNLLTLLWVLIGFFVFVIIIFACGFTWWILTYKYKFRIFDDRAGVGFEEGRLVRGRKLRVNGIDKYWIPKENCYVSAYGRKMGKNLYWYFYGIDGFLYNCVVGELDTKRGILDVEVVDNDVKSFYINEQANINERYAKAKNWPSVLMAFTVVIAILLLVIGGYLYAKEQNKGLAVISGQVEASTRINAGAETIVVSLDKLINKLERLETNTTSSGLQTATP